MQARVRFFFVSAFLALAIVFHALSPDSASASYISNGGGASSLPSQTGNAGKFLQTDGSAAACCLSWQTAGGAGGSIGTIGARPSAAALGSNNLYFATDSYQLSRSNGATYAVFGPVYPITPADNTTFSWVNQGTATLGTNGGALLLSAPASGGVDVKLRVATAPATPYTITALVETGNNGTNFAWSGLAFRASGSGALVLFGPLSDTGRQDLTVAKYNNPTSFSATYTTARQATSRTWWLRISDNGVNRISSWSPDGFNWIQVHSVGRTDFLTADQVGFFADSNTSSNPLYISVLSWVIS